MKIDTDLIGLIISIIGLIVTIIIWITLFPYRNWPLVIIVIFFGLIYLFGRGKVESALHSGIDRRYRFNR